MTYDTIQNLPDGVRNSLPDHAQEIYKSAFNNALQEKQGDDPENVVHKIAWSAVKQKYIKGSHGWHKKDD